MPELSRFYGIIIYMYLGDHVPPHFHARYSEYEAQILISNGNVLEGELPIKQLRLVQAWVELHKDELYKNWEGLGKENAEFFKIDPLK